MIVAYGFASVWAFGVSVGMFYFAREIFSDMPVIGIVAALCVGLPIYLLFAFFPFALIEHEAGPDLVTLKKNEWHCVQSHTETHTTMIMSGKVPVPVVQTVEICDLYGRK